MVRREGCSAHLGLEPFIDEKLLGRLVQLQADISRLQADKELFELKFDDSKQLVAVERMEDDDIVKPVDEFGLKVFFFTDARIFSLMRS